MSVSWIDIIGYIWWWKKRVNWWRIKLIFYTFDLVNHNWKRICLLGIHNIVFIIVNINMVLSSCNLTLIDVNEITLLICWKDAFVINGEWRLILNDVSNVLRSFQVVLASVIINTNMTNFNVFSINMISLSHFIVILVIILNIRVWIVLMGFSKLEYNLLFLLHILVVRIN